MRLPGGRRAAALRVAILVALQFLVTAQQPPPSGERSGGVAEFEVVVDTHGSLGAALSGRLEIERFYRNDDGVSPLEARGVERGDRLVAVNRVSTEGMQPRDLRDLLAVQERPMVLRFSGRPRAGVHRMPQKPQRMSAEDLRAEGHMDVLEGPLSLFSVNVTRAMFGGLAPCFRLPLIIAKPPHACAEVTPQVSGMYVLVERGSCPFAHKAHNLQEKGAKGMIVINSEPGRFRMPLDDRWADGSTGDVLPAVMVTPKDGEKLRASVKGGEGRAFGRLVIAEECMRSDGDWHQVHDVQWGAHPELAAAQARKLSAQRRALMAESRPRVTSKGIIFNTKGRDADTASSPAGSTNSSRGSGGDGVGGGRAVAQEWDRRQGGRGKRDAQRSLKCQRANSERVKQDLRGGAVVVKRSTPTEEASAEESHSLAGPWASLFAHDGVLATAEFLPSAFGGKVPIQTQPGAATALDLIWLTTPDNCTSLLLPSPDRAKGAVGVAKVSELAPLCRSSYWGGVTRIMELAQDAGIQLLLLTHMHSDTQADGYGDGNGPRPRALRLEHLQGEAREFAERWLYMPVVEVGADEGTALEATLLLAPDGLKAEVVSRPEVQDLWEILDTLQDPQHWPQDSAQRGRLFHHLQRAHAPGHTQANADTHTDTYARVGSSGSGGVGGSIGRYRALLDAYDRVCAWAGE